jgi:hypothetical protein
MTVIVLKTREGDIDISFPFSDRSNPQQTIEPVFKAQEMPDGIPGVTEKPALYALA